MKKIFITTLFTLLATSSFAAEFPKDLSGNYACTSKEVGTNEIFKGTIEIKKTGETYSLKSIYSDGSSYEGTGIYNPATHNLSLAFINPKNAEETGVVVATVKKNAEMTSVWTYLNKTTTGTGHCVKQS